MSSANNGTWTIRGFNPGLGGLDGAGAILRATQNRQLIVRHEDGSEDTDHHAWNTNICNDIGLAGLSRLLLLNVKHRPNSDILFGKQEIDLR
jgi:hypothetical protein